MSKQKSVVTGAAGFVGNALVEALVARGDEVVALDIAAPKDPIEGVTYIAADIQDLEANIAACEGASAVFHSASVVHTKQSHYDFLYKVNVGGTKSMLEACRKRGVPRFVFVSSASAVYNGEDIENADEGAPYATTNQAPYAVTKILAEKEVLAANDETLSTCALRPHIIFGPGDARFLPAIVDRARAGKLRFAVGRQRKLSDFTYITNLTDALVAAEEHLSPDSAVAGQAYFITNGEPTAFWDFVGMLLEELDLPPVRGAVPYRVAWTVAAIAEGITIMRGGKVGHEDGLTRFAIRYMCTHHYFDISKARRDLEWEPKVNIREGVALTARAV